MDHSEDGNLIHVSRRFFKRARLIHLVLSILMLGDGVVALVLSYGSKGDAQHLSFVIISSVCIYYLQGDGERSVGVNSWVTVFSINSSVIVLFNVMGVVFAVVNGLCISGQQCYYDRNEHANRFIAIALVLLHCLSILVNVLLAKRSHLIGSQFQHDVSVKFIHTMVWLRRKRSRKVSMTSQLPSLPESCVDASENSTFTSPTQRENTPTLTEVQTSKRGSVMATIEIMAMRKHKTHRRTKSHPNMIRNIDLKPDDMEGTVYSIYSDSEMKKSEESKKKKIGLFRKRKKNKVDSESLTSSTKDSVASFTERLAIKTPIPVQLVLYADDSSDSILVEKPVGGAQGGEANRDLSLAEQRKLQRKQEEVLGMQNKLLEQQKTFMATVKSDPGAPPPYQTFANSAETDDESSV
ncbi:uncharacterized protein LOC127845257 isoform X2 [Dreissena polymorpha]|uniref:uncharacterized protein LOC127845257 isoform X2 n=1 Tax=Dreissena polymorpha TaxID=45954 RepID=UPI002263BD73|nr:uncharacterized protein LOC127845257 isoform X2 [Dreissena polymorpha]